TRRLFVIAQDIDYRKQGRLAACLRRPLDHSLNPAFSLQPVEPLPYIHEVAANGLNSQIFTDRVMYGQQQGVRWIGDRNSRAVEIDSNAAVENIFRPKTGSHHFPVQVDLAVLTIQSDCLVAREAG